MKNSIASTLKSIGMILGVIGIIGAFMAGSALKDSAFDGLAVGVGFYVFLSCGFSALCVYAFGEVISLLQDIKNNAEYKPVKTSATVKSERLDESIPKI